jgi:hypothetical protein
MQSRRALDWNHLEDTFMAVSPEESKAKMIAGLREKTGKSLEDWLKILRSSKLSKHKEFMTLLMV